MFPFTDELFNFFQPRSKTMETIVSLPCDIFFHTIYFNLHTSAPLRLPIVTLKFGLSFFSQTSLLLNKSDFLECIIVSITFLILIRTSCLKSYSLTNYFTKNFIMELVKRLSKNDTTIILLQLWIKANRKVRDSQSTSGIKRK